MSCLSDEVLRAQLDNELSEAERQSAGQHLATCAACRTRLEAISRASDAVAQSLGELAPLAAGQDAGLDRALSKFQARLDLEGSPKPRNPVVNIFVRHPMPACGGAAIAALVIIMAAFAPARSLGQRVLAMLRVEKVTVVPVDFNVSPGPDTQALIRQVISSDITVTLSPGKPQSVASATQASALAGFQVRVSPNGPGAPQIGVVGEQAYSMTLDQNRLQSILDSFGRSDLQLPATINGQMIAVHIPKLALIRYGNCAWKRSGSPDANDQQPMQQPTPASGAGCIMMVEAPSPIVSVPPDLNVNQLFQIALEAAGMSAEQAQAFCQTVDWKSTLVVPIPSRASSYVQEQVDGVQGDLIVGPSRNGRPAEFELIWVKNGIIYSIHGFGDSNQALALAGSLG